MERGQERRFKVVLLGEGRVGKTSLLLRYVRSLFDPQQASTVQASYLEKTLHINTTKVTLNIWDTAGQERYHSLGPIYYRNANAAVLVYDISDRESMNKVQDWVRELRTMVGSVPIWIVGNKADMERQRKVRSEDATGFADSVQARHVSTSAKTGAGVEDLFLDVAKTLLRQKPKPSKVKSQYSRSTIQIEQHVEPQSKGCC